MSQIFCQHICRIIFTIYEVEFNKPLLYHFPNIMEVNIDVLRSLFCDRILSGLCQDCGFLDQFFTFIFA